jgi:hypothetical protein
MTTTGANRAVLKRQANAEAAETTIPMERR